MAYGDGRFHITYNGEVYNYVELRRRLEAKGYKFRGTSDTEVLLAAYADRGENCLEDVDGMFSFAIWDEARQQLFCARDRFGEKPFYYVYTSGMFGFASELKGLFAGFGRRPLSRRHVFNYLLYGIAQDALDPATTFYEGLRQLPAASCLVLDGGQPQVKRYWDLDLSRRLEIDDGAAVTRFRRLFTESVQRRLRSDVPVGTSLSGGLDSSSVVMQVDHLKTSTQLQKTFSATFPGYERDESEFARLVAAHTTGAEQHFVSPSVRTAIDQLRDIVYHQEYPFGSASIVAQYNVMRLARANDVVVLLDGQGADEVLAGYFTYFPSYLLQLYRHDRQRFRAARAVLEATHGPIALNRGWRRLLQAYAYPMFKLFGDARRRLKDPRSEYFHGIHPDLVREFRAERSPLEEFPELRRQLAYTIHMHSLGELLRYADRNAMAHSVEVRLPFLSHELVEFVFALPDQQRIRDGWTKFLLRSSMAGALPDEIAWRRDKIGYEAPQQRWLTAPPFRQLLAEAVDDLAREQIIVRAEPYLSWSYIMLFLVRQSFG
jgi:asparagine synthase (glutamine-hydrolysing)